MGLRTLEWVQVESGRTVAMVRDSHLARAIRGDRNRLTAEGAENAEDLRVFG